MSVEFAPTQVNKEVTTERKQVRIIFPTHGFINNVGNIPTCKICSLQWYSQTVQISRSLLLAVPSGCLSTQASVKLCRSASRDFYVNSPYSFMNAYLLMSRKARNIHSSNKWRIYTYKCKVNDILKSYIMIGSISGGRQSLRNNHIWNSCLPVTRALTIDPTKEAFPWDPSILNCPKQVVAISCGRISHMHSPYVRTHTVCLLNYLVVNVQITSCSQ